MANTTIDEFKMVRAKTFFLKIDDNFGGLYIFYLLGNNLIPSLQGWCAAVPRKQNNERQMRRAKKRKRVEAQRLKLATSTWAIDVVVNNNNNNIYLYNFFISKQILDGLCHQMGKFEKECLSLVEEYFEVIYDILVSEIHPKEICKAVGLCGPNSVFNSDVRISWSS